MPTAIDNYQPSVAITEAVLLQGIYPPREGGGGGGQGYIGAVRHYAFNFAPGNATASGQILPISQNTALFSILGTTYGGNGTTTFALPDLDLRLSVGEGFGVGLTGRAEGTAFGIAAPVLSLSDMPGIVGGTPVAVDNTAPSLPVHYVINLYGIYQGFSLNDIGMVWEFAGNFAPAGTHDCDGSLLSIAENDALFSLIGTTYGGDGITTFALPDLRGRTIVGADTGDHVLGTASGSEDFVITTANLPSGVHFGTDTGHDAPIDNEGPSLALTYMIAVQGIFPSRDGPGSGDASTPYLGEIVASAVGVIPPGFMACNGQLLPINQNQALFALLGTTYGGNGQTTFALPDLRGRAIVGADGNFGAILGSDQIVLTLDDVPGLVITGDDGNQDGVAAFDLAGANGDDSISGLGGNDLLWGRGGNDGLNGGTGADIMNGGTGSDVYVVDDLGDVVNESAGQGTDQIRTELQSYSLAGTPNVENLAGLGTLDQQLTGNDGANRISGGAGADTMIGGLGNDNYVVDQAGDVVVETAAGGTDTVESFISYALGTNLENLTLLGTGAINATGNGGNNVLTGNSAANRMDGAAGADSMRGGGGDDVYIVDNVGDSVQEYAGAGTDLVQSFVSFTLGAYVENLTLVGGAAVNATGNDLDNILIGNGAANILNGRGGADTMRGGAGDDTYFVDNAGDSLREYGGAGTDLVNASVSWSLGAYQENLQLTGTAAINGTGNDLDNVLIGNSGANALVGGRGADTLDGGLGNDTLNGGIGADLFRFSTALGASNHDTIVGFNAVDDTIQLDRSVFGAFAADGALSASEFRAGTSAQDADDHIIYDAATGHLYYDADGNGAEAQILFAVLSPGTAIGSADFAIIG